jgi:protein-L-isoaspartate(D-aspartate) O-methyltransferase
VTLSIIGPALKHSGDRKLDHARERMLAEHLRGRDIADATVLEAMAEIPRERFVPQGCHAQAYADGPLPIGQGQTISQPYIVALMTQLLNLNTDCEVLEIGTGSGYQTAVAARLAGKVYTIEVLPELSQSAQAALEGLGIDNVEFAVGDGSCGWQQDRTFDRIIVTAAVPTLPAPLLNQLAEGGRIVAPVGCGSMQTLILADNLKGKLIEQPVCSCRFVRLIGRYGFDL